MGSAMTGDRQAPDVDPAIRRALPTEAAVLSSLALRSKSHWGYDVDFLAACRDDLTLSADDIATSVVYVFDGADAPSGFYRLVAPGRRHGGARRPLRRASGDGARDRQAPLAARRVHRYQARVLGDGLAKRPASGGVLSRHGRAARRRISIDSDAGSDAAPDALPAPPGKSSPAIVLELTRRNAGLERAAAQPPEID